MERHQPTPPAPTPSASPSVIFIAPTPGSRARAEMPTQLPLKSFHFVFGIIQISIGGVMLLLEIITIAVQSHFVIMATGIYCGILVLVSGLLGLLAAQLNSRRLIIACMILSIIAAVACGIGLIISSVEVISPWSFGMAKWQSVIMMILCLAELVMTIIHACLSCRSFCRCCMPGMFASSGRRGAQGAQGAYQANYFPAQRGAYMPQGAMFVQQGANPQGAISMGQAQPFVYLNPQQPQQPQGQPEQPPSYNAVTQEKGE